MVKLIVTDVDGTLVEDGGSVVDARLHEVVKELKEQGIVFAVCSGRSYASIYKLFEPVADDVIFCCENGAFIICRDYVIAEHHIKSEYVKELIEESKHIDNITPCVTTPRTMYVNRANDAVREWLGGGYGMHCEFLDRLEDAPVDGVTKFCVLDHRGVHEHCAKEFDPKWWDLLNVVEAGLQWLDFMRKDVSKGGAVRNLQEYLGISEEETMVFGDNHNDIQMLKVAKYNFATANARQEVLDVADYITASNVEGGVLQVIERVLKGEDDFEDLRRK